MALDLNDKTSNGNNLTNVNTVADSNSVPFSGNNTDSALFTATSSMMLETGTSPTNLNLTSALTIEAWIKVTTISVSPMTIGARWTASAGNLLQFDFQVNRNSGGKLTFLGSSDGANANFGPGVDSTGAVTANAYHHVAFTWDGSTGIYYIDAVASGSGSMSGTLFSVVSPRFTIGADILAGPGQYFDGNIDEVRLWNVARTAGQISANYNIQLNGNESNLVGYWPFNAPGNSKGGFFAAAR